MRTTLTITLVFLAGWFFSRLAPSQQAEASPGPTDFSAVIAALDPGVVHITTSTSGARPRSRDDNVGAGFVIDAGGLVATNRHVVSGARRIQVHVKGRGSVVARVLGTDDATDVALLRIPLDGLTPVPIGTARGLRAGQWVLAAGSPYRLAHSWSVGIVGALGRTGVGVNPRGTENYIQTDAAANLGNSGGPLVDAAGKVVGMVTAILSRATGHQGVTLAVPIDEVMESIAQMKRGDGGSVSRPSIGVRVREERSGLRVTGFDSGSPAPDAGMRLGDLIVRVGTTNVRQTAELRRAVFRAGAQGKIRVVFMRNGRAMSATVSVH